MHQIELAESRRKKSIAHKVNTCRRGKRNDIFKTRLDSMSEGIHRSLDVYDALKLQNRRGGEEEELPDYQKDFAARKKMQQCANNANLTLWGHVASSSHPIWGFLARFDTLLEQQWVRNESWNDRGPRSFYRYLSARLCPLLFF